MNIIIPLKYTNVSLLNPFNIVAFDSYKNKIQSTGLFTFTPSVIFLYINNNTRQFSFIDTSDEMKAIL